MRLPKRSRKRRRKGGWKAQATLTWDEVKDAHEIDHALEARGYRRAFFVTERSAGETDSERKRSLHKRRGHMGEAIERAGHPFLCVTVFEKPPGKQLHSHSIVYGARAQLEAVMARIGHLDMKPKARARELSVPTHIRPAIPSDVPYITKARRPKSPEHERKTRHRRVPNEPIPGRMLSISQLVKDMLADMAPLESRAVEPEPIRPPAYVEPSPQLKALMRAKAAPPPLAIVEAAGGQLAFDVGPPINLALDLEKHRRAKGMSQEAAAAKVGIARPTLANAARGQSRLSPWARQRIAELLKAA